MHYLQLLLHFHCLAYTTIRRYDQMTPTCFREPPLPPRAAMQTRPRLPTG